MLPTRPNQINPSVEFSYKEEYTIKLILTEQEAAIFLNFFYKQKGEGTKFLSQTHITTSDKILGKRH